MSAKVPLRMEHRRPVKGTFHKEETTFPKTTVDAISVWGTARKPNRYLLVGNEGQERTGQSGKGVWIGIEHTKTDY
jgi:hypothetical protein